MTSHKQYRDVLCLFSVFVFVFTFEYMAIMGFYSIGTEIGIPYVRETSEQLCGLDNVARASIHIAVRRKMGEFLISAELCV